MIAIHIGPVVNASNCLARIRVVPDHKDGNLIYGRSLRPGEPDGGQGIPVFERMSLKFPVGSIQLTIADVECHTDNKIGSYSPVTNVVWTWLALPPMAEQKEFVDYLLAAARRLDEGYAHCERMLSHLYRLQETELTSTNFTDSKWIPTKTAFEIRNSAAEVLGAAESMCVALGRVVRMVEGAQQSIGTTIAIPDEIGRILRAVIAIRHAFEHIDERAVGRAHQDSPDVAVSICNQTELFATGVLQYGDYALNIHQDIVPAFFAARQFILDAAMIHGETKILPSPIFMPAPIEWKTFMN